MNANIYDEIEHNKLHEIEHNSGLLIVYYRRKEAT